MTLCRKNVYYICLQNPIWEKKLEKREDLEKMLGKRKPPFESEGVHHATINGHRFHLRPSNGGQNLLWINGQMPLVLDVTATRFMIFIIDAMWRLQRGEGDRTDDVVRYVVQKMHEIYGKKRIGKKAITQSQIRDDLHRFYSTIMEIAEGKCPIEMGLAGKEISYAQWKAPARMDLAVTYRCNLRCPKCYLPNNDPTEELTVSEWRAILTELWGLGIPQVVFTGGEPLIRDDIHRLVSSADLFVTGLVTNGTLLEEKAATLADASLDYVQVTIESSNGDIHDSMTNVKGSHIKTVGGITAAIEAGLQVVTNTTLTASNADGFLETMRWIAMSLGVKHIACNTIICSGRGASCSEWTLPDKRLRVILEAAKAEADRLNIGFQWYSPTCYTKGINPLTLGFGAKSCSAAAQNMLITPTGDVLPCQSWPNSVGNIIKDEWDSIWNHPTCQKLRNHEFADPTCGQCYDVAICGGGCPLDKSKRISRNGGKE